MMRSISGGNESIAQGINSLRKSTFSEEDTFSEEVTFFKVATITHVIWENDVQRAPFSEDHYCYQRDLIGEKTLIWRDVMTL